MTQAKNDPEIQKTLEQLGKRIRELRLKKGYPSFERFAFENEINRVQYGRYENGANISFANLVKLIKAFDLSVSEFFAEGFDGEGE